MTNGIEIRPDRSSGKDSPGYFAPNPFQGQKSMETGLADSAYVTRRKPTSDNKNQVL